MVHQMVILAPVGIFSEYPFPFIVSFFAESCVSLFLYLLLDFFSREIFICASAC